MEYDKILDQLKICGNKTSCRNCPYEETDCFNKLLAKASKAIEDLGDKLSRMTDDMQAYRDIANRRE